MNMQLMQMLSEITEEEQKILNGNGIEKNVYTDKSEFTVDKNKMLKKGRYIDVRPHTRFTAFPHHKHNYIEMMYVASGSIIHIINGERAEVSAGDIIFLNSSCSHEIMTAGKDDIGINFIILPEFLDTVFKSENTDDVSSAMISVLYGNSPAYMHFKVSHVLPIQNLIENLVWSFLYKHDYNYTISKSTMGLLLLQLINNTDKIACGNETKYDNLIVTEAIKYIEASYKSATLTECSELLHQSASKLCRLLKQYTGHTFKELLQIKRLETAAELLLKSRLSVTEIINAAGYDNTSYFHRIFKEGYGESPAVFRKNGR